MTTPLALLFAALVPPSAQVWVVAPALGAGVDFTSIQAAVNAAADGDVILIRTGNYAGASGAIRIDGKSLTLTRDSGAASAFASLEIVNLPGSGSVVVRGLNMATGTTKLSGCVGDVWLDTCGLDTVTVTDCASVLFTHCAILGNNALLNSPSNPPTEALHVAGSSVHAFDSWIVGGAGGKLVAPSSGIFYNGEEAIVADACELSVSGGSVEGGTAGSFYHWICTLAEAGTGIRVDGGAVVRVLDAVMFGGAADCIGLAWPPVAPPFVIASGSLSTLPGAARSLACDSPKREGQTLTIHLLGQPGDLAFYALSLAQDPFYFQPFFGTLAVALPAAVKFVGTVPAGGALQASVLVPDQGAGIEGIPSFLQGGFLTPSQELRVSSPSALVILDASL